MEIRLLMPLIKKSITKNIKIITEKHKINIENQLELMSKKKIYKIKIQ